MHTIISYDGSFDGFLSCIFAIYEHRIQHPIIEKNSSSTDQLFSDRIYIHTEEEKAKRVWSKLVLISSTSIQHKIFRTFLSEIKGSENILFNLIKRFFEGESNVDKDFSNKDILKITQVAKMVGREKHRMEAFVRFQLTKDGLYVATIEPDFNVLPLIIPHFKDRYSDQKWLIYDLKRAYGIYYDLEQVDIITVDFFSKNHVHIPEEHLDPTEKEFQKIWSSYYQSVNIKSRKNTKLHLQHIPKRYWKYMTEKIT